MNKYNQDTMASTFRAVYTKLSASMAIIFAELSRINASIPARVALPSSEGRSYIALKASIEVISAQLGKIESSHTETNRRFKELQDEIDDALEQREEYETRCDAWSQFATSSSKSARRVHKEVLHLIESIGTLTDDPAFRANGVEDGGEHAKSELRRLKDHVRGMAEKLKCEADKIAEDLTVLTLEPPDNDDLDMMY